MSISSRVPGLNSMTKESAAAWFSSLADLGLMYHPEDDPADIVRTVGGLPVFSSEEASELRDSMKRLTAAIGHTAVIAAAYKPFMLAAGHDPAILD